MSLKLSLYVVSFQAKQVYAVRPCIKKEENIGYRPVEVSPQVKTTAMGALSLIPEAILCKRTEFPKLSSDPPHDTKQ